MAHPQIAAFARLAKGGQAPNRVIFGQATKLGRTMHDIRYNARRDEIYVTNPFAGAILTFRGSAKGEEAPIRVIQGPKTLLDAADTLSIDEVNDEIIVPNRSSVLVFPLTGNGDIAPLRVLRATENGWRTGSGSAVDPVHNVLVVDGRLLDGKSDAGPGTAASPSRSEARALSTDSLLIFDRTANGDAKPLRVIRGPHTGMKSNKQLQIYPKTGYILVAEMRDGEDPEPEGTFVGVWSVNDDGDVPPRWKIEGKPANVMKKPQGVAFNARNKEVIVADMSLNSVLTFYFPEMF